MAFTLDATVGGASSNSYVTLAEANSYFASHISSSSWDAAQNQEVLLSHSSRLLDHYMDWLGEPMEDESLQSMGWPRSGLDEIFETNIPQRVKNAAFELANYLAANGTSVDEGDVTRIRVGPLSIDLQEDGSGHLLPPEITRLLTSLGSVKPLPKNGISTVSLTR